MLVSSDAPVSQLWREDRQETSCENPVLPDSVPRGHVALPSTAGKTATVYRLAHGASA